MSTPQQNVEAYRILGDILTTLRAALRAGLEKEFGPRWFDQALPRTIFSRLVERKEKEKAVNVFDGSYFTLLEYADFDDVKELSLAHPQVAPFLRAFGGNQQICQARFMELQGLHEKLAGLRNVNEAELSFLQHLVRRLHQIVDPSAHPEPDRTTWADRPEGGNGQPKPAAEAPRAAEPLPAPAPASVSQPAPPPQPAEPPPPVPATPQSPEPPRAAAPKPAPAPVAPKPAESRANSPAQTPAADLGRALEEGDDKAIIAALFGEVRRLSEHMTDSQGPATPPVWDKVSESSWYSRRYSSLGMRPVSDFYNLYLGLRERISEGAGNQELQGFLQAHAYQQVIMAVGVFFQQNKVS